VTHRSSPAGGPSRRGAVLAAAVAITVGLACRPARPAAGPPAPVEVPGLPASTLTLTCESAPEALLGVGDTLPFVASRLHAVRRYQLACDPVPGAALTWTTSDTTVASVDAGGVVRGRAPGRVTLRAAWGDSLRGERGVRVLPPVTAVRWARRAVALAVGDTARLTAAAFGADGRVLERLEALAVTPEDGAPAADVVRWADGFLTVVARRPGTLQVVARVAARADTAVVTVHGP